MLRTGFNLFRGLELLEGVEVSDETLAVAVFDQVGPKGDFLTQDHTLKHMRSMSQAVLFDRNSHEVWMRKSEGKDLVERAYEEARQILSTHQPAQLPRSVGEELELDAIIQSYEAELFREKDLAV